MRKKPSAVNSVAASSGRRQYPEKTFGPRTSMPPIAPAGAGPASSTTRTSTSGSANPTVPGRRSPSSGLDVIIDVSVMP